MEGRGPSSVIFFRQTLKISKVIFDLTTYTTGTVPRSEEWAQISTRMRSKKKKRDGMTKTGHEINNNTKSELKTHTHTHLPESWSTMKPFSIFTWLRKFLIMDSSSDIQWPEVRNGAFGMWCGPDVHIYFDEERTSNLLLWLKKNHVVERITDLLVNKCKIKSLLRCLGFYIVGVESLAQISEIVRTYGVS